MRAVRADRELELEQELVRFRSLGVIGSPKLSTDLTELARPIREHERLPRVVKVGDRQQIGSIEAHASKPAARELIVARQVPPTRVLETVRLIASADDVLAATKE